LKLINIDKEDAKAMGAGSDRGIQSSCRFLCTCCTL